MKNIAAAANRLKNTLSVHLTTELRQSALKSGWHPDVASRLSVKHKDGVYSVTIPQEYQDRAFVHEYGDENSKPTAVLRKFTESNGHVEGFKNIPSNYLGVKQ